MIELAVEEFVAVGTEETWLFFNHMPGEPLGNFLCGSCFENLDRFLETTLSDEKELRSVDDLIELEEKLRVVDEKRLHEEIKQKEKMAIAMAWLNKNKEHKDLLKCPECKSILIPDF